MAFKEALPKRVLSRLIASSLPPGYTCSEDTASVINDCAVEFLQLLTSEANEKCMAQSKKGGCTMTPKHVNQAMEELGFAHYLPSMSATGTVAANNAATRLTAKRTGKRKLERSNLSMDELKRKQQLMFEKARASMEGKISSGATSAAAASGAVAAAPAAL